MNQSNLFGKIFVVRHGEIDFNLEGRYAGSTDLSLNSTGMKQAKMTKKKMEQKNISIDLIFTSPLKRAQETAKIINFQNAKIIIDDRIRERSVGVFEGLTRKEVQEKYPNLWAQNITRIFDKAPTDGETILEVQNRVFDFLDEIRKKYPKKNILISTHAFVAKIINKYFHPGISEKEFFDFVQKNAEVKEYSFQNLQLTEEFNEWNKLKIEIEKTAKYKNTKPGEIWWSYYGKNIGFEQNGGLKFRRPVIILKRINFMLVLAAPLTSKIKNNNSNFYFKIRELKDNPIAILAQIKVISTKRFLRKKNRISKQGMGELLKEIEKFYFK